MKVILEFELPDEQEEYDTCMNAVDNEIRLNEIWEQVFRPYLKHGYSDQKLTKLVDSKDGQYIMNALIDLYQKTGGTK